MLVGHYASSLIAKRLAPEIPLGLLFIAAQFIDIFWAIFVLEGVEHFRLVPGFTASNPLDLYYMPYTHSLPATLVWGLVFAAMLGLFSKRFQTKSTFFAIFMVVISHWFLDLIVHIPDLPLWGNQYKQGLGLWQYREITLALELGLLFMSTAYVSKITVFRNQSKELWFLIAAMAAIQVLMTYGSAPESASEVTIMALVSFFLFAYLAHLTEKRASNKHLSR